MNKLSLKDEKENGYIAIVRYEGEKKMGILNAAYGTCVVRNLIINLAHRVVRCWCTCSTFGCNTILSNGVLVAALRSVIIFCDCKWLNPGTGI